MWLGYTVSPLRSCLIEVHSSQPGFGRHSAHSLVHQLAYLQVFTPSPTARPSGPTSALSLSSAACVPTTLFLGVRSCHGTNMRSTATSPAPPKCHHLSAAWDTNPPCSPARRRRCGSRQPKPLFVSASAPGESHRPTWSKLLLAWNNWPTGGISLSLYAMLVSACGSLPGTFCSRGIPGNWHLVLWDLSPSWGSTVLLLFAFDSLLPWGEYTPRFMSQDSNLLTPPRVFNGAETCTIKHLLDCHSVPGGLGGLRSRGKIMDPCKVYPRQISHSRLSQSSSSAKRRFVVGGYCYDLI